jgi:hypothetical protein
MIGRIIALLLVAAGSLAAGDSGGVWLETAEQAVARVYAYTDFKELKDIKGGKAEEICRKIVVEEDDTPFLWKQVIGRYVWEVKLNNIYLDMPDWDPWLRQTKNGKNFTALVDVETGVLYRVYSKINYDDPDLAPEPPPESATVWGIAEHEVYAAFPSAPPAVALHEALNAASGSNPLAAKEVIAVCVMYSHLDQEAIPVWSITGRGIPDMGMLGGDDVPPYARKRMRTVVNAEDGKPLFMTNMPRVLPRPEDRK